MIPEEARLEIVRKKNLGETWTGIARWLEAEHGISVHRTTVQRWYDREVYLDEEIDDEFSTEDRVKLDKKIETYKAESRFWKKLYETAIKDSTKKELIIDTIQDLAPAIRSVQIPKAKKASKSGSPQVVVAPLSDTHIGDRVKEEQMAGLNEYNIDIFNKRLYGWANTVVQLVELRRNHSPVDKLILPMLGDMISGDIHEELARTNIDNCMEQMIQGANLIAQAVIFLAGNFAEVEIPCVVGNHGRMTRKPPMKDKYMDWDFMMYQWIAAFCREQKNVTFNISKSFINSFNAGNKTVLIMHGDSVPGAGLGTTILNQVSKFRNVLSYGFDSVMMGHFHRIDEFDIGTGEVHICGTMKGGDEYAFQKLAVYSPPKHIMTYWHPEHGYIGKETLYLDNYDDSTETFNNNVPETWASLV